LDKSFRPQAKDPRGKSQAKAGELVASGTAAALVPDTVSAAGHNGQSSAFIRADLPADQKRNQKKFINPKSQQIDPRGDPHRSSEEFEIRTWQEERIAPTERI
jgi:hypothetical protein